MRKNDYELSVKVDGSKLPEYGSHGRTYVRGEIGREFTLHFKNNTADRVLARFSVDGLSVLDGRNADKDNSGYICNAYSSIEINGWRTSLDEVRKFEFSSKGKSYVGKTTGNTANCGVIGVQVYAEKQPKVKIVEKHIHHHHDHHHHDDWPWFPRPCPRPKPWPWDPWKPTPIWGDDIIYKDTSANLYSSSNITDRGVRHLSSRKRSDVTYSANLKACSLSGDDAGEVTDYNLGTKFGDRKSDSVRTVEFEVGRLITQLEIYYTDREGLENAGIDLDKKPSVAVYPNHPQAFGGFCQPPDDE